jgi:hypothetical protein
MRANVTWLVVTAVAVAGAAAGCALEDPPETPSWQVDVMPVLAANCVRCHGEPRNPLVPSDFRLDAYGATRFPGQSVPVKGASEFAVDMARVTEPGFQSNFEERMPPDRTLDDRSYLILRNWAGSANGANIAPRGPGRADNHTPTITLEETGRTSGVITFAFEVDDLDHDLVTGVLLGPVPGEVPGTLDGEPGTVGLLVSGRRTFDWDTSALPPGSYQLTARLDDGADIDGPDGNEDYIDVPLVTVVLP